MGSSARIEYLYLRRSGKTDDVAPVLLNTATQLNSFFDMSLSKTIYNDLEHDQLKAIAKMVDIPDHFSRKHLGVKIVDALRSYYKAIEGRETHKDDEILSLWGTFVYEIIDQRKVRAENKKRKQQVLQEIIALYSQHRLDCHDRVESVVRDILLLLWEESTDAEKKKFRDVVRQDLNKHNVKFTEQEFSRATQGVLVGGTGSAIPILTAIVTGHMLNQMTVGFASWFAVTFLGQKALTIAALGLLSGPVAWGISLGALGVGTVASVTKYQCERRKLAFVQTILTIYSYSYQNRFKQR